MPQSVQWTGHGLDNQEFMVQFPARARYFSLLHSIQNGSGAQTALYSTGILNSFNGTKQPVWEADQSPPSYDMFQVGNSILIYILIHSTEQSPSWEANWFSAFYGTKKFITTFTRVCHLSPFSARSIQSMPHFLKMHFIILPPQAWVFQVVSFPQVSQP